MNIIYMILISHIFLISVFSEIVFTNYPYPKLPIGFDDPKYGLCRNHSKMLWTNLQNNTMWAFKMWDASAKEAVGIAEGNMYQLGHYEECLSVQEPIRAQYCLVHIRVIVNTNITIHDKLFVNYEPYGNFSKYIKNYNNRLKVRRDILHTALCLPESCIPHQISDALQLYFNNVSANSDKRYEVTVNSEDCQQNTPVTWNIADICFSFLFILLVMIISVCTYKVQKEKTDDERTTFGKVINCFCAKGSYRDLIQYSNNSTLNILNGYKTIFMCINVFIHGGTVISIGSVANIQVFETLISSNFNRWVGFRFYLGIEIFFLMSGLLSTYTYMMQSDKISQNPLRLIIIRYFRVVPLLAFTAFFYATVFIKLGSGPLWTKIIGEEKKSCEGNWIYQLLVVHNYVGEDNYCMKQSWYICCDFHFFMMSVPLNMLIRKNAKAGFTLLTAILGLSLLSHFLVVYLGNHDPTWLMNLQIPQYQHDYFKKVYIKSHTRASSYIVGMYFGYIYYKLKHSQFTLTSKQSYMLITGSVLTGLVAIMGGYPFSNPYRSYTAIQAATYAALHQPLFALTLGILTIVLTHGSLKFIRSILTSKSMVILGKLTFGLYLTHFVFILKKIGSAQQPLVLFSYETISSVVMDICLGFISALILYVLIENPTRKLTKYFFEANRTNYYKKV